MSPQAIQRENRSGASKGEFTLSQESKAAKVNGQPPSGWSSVFSELLIVVKMIELLICCKK
jgi:hypothetical protein